MVGVEKVLEIGEFFWVGGDRSQDIAHDDEFGV